MNCSLQNVSRWVPSCKMKLWEIFLFKFYKEHNVPPIKFSAKIKLKYITMGTVFFLFITKNWGKLSKYRYNQNTDKRVKEMVENLQAKTIYILEIMSRTYKHFVWIIQKISGNEVCVKQSIRTGLFSTRLKNNKGQ